MRSNVSAQAPTNSKVAKKSSIDEKRSHSATTIGIVFYVAIQLFLPFSHNFTPVIIDLHLTFAGFIHCRQLHVWSNEPTSTVFIETPCN